MKKNTPITQIKYKYYHWGPFLFQTQLTLKECKMIIKEGQKCRKKNNDFRHELAGHLSDEYQLTNLNKIAECLKKYFEAYVIAYNEWRGGKPTMQPKFQMTALWINYMKANDFNPPHEHGADLLLFILICLKNYKKKIKHLKVLKMAPQVYHGNMVKVIVNVLIQLVYYLKLEICLFFHLLYNIGCFLLDQK